LHLSHDGKLGLFKQHYFEPGSTLQGSHEGKFLSN